MLLYGTSWESHLRVLVCWEFGSVKRSRLGSAEQRKNCKTKRMFSFFLHSLSVLCSHSVSEFIYLLWSDTKLIIELRWSIYRDNLMRTASTCGPKPLLCRPTRPPDHAKIWVICSYSLIQPTVAFHKTAPQLVAETSAISKPDNIGRSFELKGRNFKLVFNIVKWSQFS